LSSSVASILTDGSTSATISALARDASNNVLAGVPVTFTASSGAIQVTQATTDATGTAQATLTTGGDSAARTITVTGATGSLTSTVQIPVVAPSTPTTPVYSMGNGSGSTFTSGAIGVATTGQLAAGGTTALQISIVDQTNTLYTGGLVSVTFNSPCIASQNAGILVSGSNTPVTAVSTTTGSVNVTYEALGCSGTDLVTATATVAGQSLSATASLSIAQASIGSIQFVSATPTTIGLKGTGLGETSTVIFKVTDSTGGARSGVTVSFALNTTVGGMSLSPTTATSASDGTVQTVVSSGTVHTVVRVTASIASPALSTQSSQLTVTTGLPASAAFSIAVGVANYGGIGSNLLACPNVEGWDIDGVTVPVTVQLADRYNNPVPDGTAVAFYTNGGHIDGSCTTPLTTSGDGSCKVTWTSANPRPALNSDSPSLLAAGRATVLATTIGEESFTDVNGSGFWQTGDPFVNLGEPYADANENGVHDPDEYFLDFNQNGRYDGPPSPASFVGITCTGTSAGSTCTTQTLAIGAPHLIIMSTSAASPSLVSASGFTNSGSATSPNLTISHTGSGTLVINVQDANGNSMAASTGIAYSVAPTTLGTYTAIGPTQVGCNADVGGQNFEVQFAPSTSAAAGSSGNLTVLITSPNGTQTPFVIPITLT
jgi:hypothetical protein